MTTHNRHAADNDGTNFVLEDGCPRCEEQAEDPIRLLDDGRVYALVARVVDELDARSDNEALAMQRIRQALDAAGKLSTIAPELVETYLLRRWHVPARIKGGNTPGKVQV